MSEKPKPAINAITATFVDAFNIVANGQTARVVFGDAGGSPDIADMVPRVSIGMSIDGLRGFHQTLGRVLDQVTASTKQTMQ